jgi:hypothetical protein
VTWGKFAPVGVDPPSDAPAGRGCLAVTVQQILGALKGQVIQGAMLLRVSDAEEQPSLPEEQWLSWCASRAGDARE